MPGPLPPYPGHKESILKIWSPEALDPHVFMVPKYFLKGYCRSTSRDRRVFEETTKLHVPGTGNSFRRLVTLSWCVCIFKMSSSVPQMNLTWINHYMYLAMYSMAGWRTVDSRDMRQSIRWLGIYNSHGGIDKNPWLKNLDFKRA